MLKGSTFLAPVRISMTLPVCPFCSIRISAVAEKSVDDAARKNQQQAGVDHIHRHHRKAMTFAVQRTLLPSLILSTGQCSFFSARSAAFSRVVRVPNRQLSLGRSAAAEVRIRLAVRPRIKAPGVGEAIDRDKDDAQAQQPEQGRNHQAVKNSVSVRRSSQRKRFGGIGSL